MENVKFESKTHGLTVGDEVVIGDVSAHVCGREDLQLLLHALSKSPRCSELVY